MSKKIIGVTVGTLLPKPNFDQTDPAKGDYIKGDRSFLKAIKTINGVKPDDGGDIVVPVNELQQDLSRISTELEEISNFVKEESETDLSQYLRGKDGNVELGYRENQYKLQVNTDGVEVFQGNTSMTHIGQNTVSAPAFEAARTVKIGNHTIKMSTSGTLMFN